jgi:sugar (pentulose or hexulose) kinase
MTANVTGFPVRSGLFEATVVGNALVQAIAAGQFAGLWEARKHVEAVTRFSTFTPSACASQLADLYVEIEESYQ